MNRRNRLQVFVILLLAAALMGVSVVTAQQEEPVPAKQMPAVVEKGESGSPAASQSESEPNNDRASADPFDAATVMYGVIQSEGDVDYYSLSGFELGVYLIDIDAARYGSSLDSSICVQGVRSGNVDYEYCNDDSDGLDSLLLFRLWDYRLRDYGVDWYVKVRDLSDRGGAAFHYKLMVYQPLLVSAATDGTVAGVAFKSSDVLAHYDFADGTEKWMLFFDASDVGITRNVNGLQIDGDAYMLLSFTANQALPGVVTITPFDIVGFYPEQLGPATSGTFSPGFFGGGAGLNANSEKIDALGSDDYWTISTVGTAIVPTWSGRLTSRDEDMMLMIWECCDEWDDTLYFDGSAIPGLAAEDITAAHTGGRYEYFTIQGSGRVDGLAVNQRDIFVVDRDWNRVLGHYWRAGQHHFPYSIDAIHLFNP